MVAIFVLLTFIVFILVDLLVLKAQKKTHPAFAPSYTVADLSIFTKDSLAVPANIFLSKGHTWAKKIDAGLIQIGVDEFLLKALGKITITKIADIGKEIKRGDVILEGKFNGKNVKFRSPIEGTISSVNPDLIGKKLEDPFGRDWGILLTPKNLKENLMTLISGSEIEKWLKSEFSRLKDFLSAHSPKPELAGITMQDGGNVVEGAIASINDEGQEAFEKEFLNL